MSKKIIIKGIVLAIIAVIGIGTGVALLRKKYTKMVRKQADNPNKNEQESCTPDKVCESFFEKDIVLEDQNYSDEKPKDVIVKLRDRTFWGVYGSLVISSLVVMFFAAAMTIVSLVGQKAYSIRKAKEALQETQKQRELFEEQQKRGYKQIEDLFNRLDSIDTHIKLLKSSKPVESKKKGK